MTLSDWINSEDDRGSPPPNKSSRDDRPVESSGKELYGEGRVPGNAEDGTRRLNEDILLVVSNRTLKRIPLVKVQGTPQSETRRTKLARRSRALLFLLTSVMPPKRVAVTVSVGSPAKRQRRVGVIGAATQGDDTARLIAAHHLAEHAGHGQSYLSRRAVNVHNSGAVKPLSATALQVSAQGLLELLKLPGKVEATPGALGNVGWDKDREATGASTAEVEALRTYVKSLPETLANRLLASVVALSAAAIESSEDAGGISVLALANMFLHERTTALSLSNLSAPALLISRIPQCTNLVSLDLSTHLTLKDGPLAKILSDLKSLEKINLRGCTKIGDASVIALSKGSESRLKEVNLSLTAVTVKGLKSLFARCSALEVLKLANVQGLVSDVALVKRQRLIMCCQNERAISSLIQDSTSACAIIVVSQTR